MRYLRSYLTREFWYDDNYTHCVPSKTLKEVKSPLAF